MTEPVRVAVVARYPSQRAELMALLDGAAGLRVAGDVSGSAEFEDAAPQTGVDVIVSDDDTDDRGGLFAAAERAGAGVVVLADLVDASQIAAGLPPNGSGILLRDATSQELAAAIVAVAAHLSVYDPRVAAALAARRRDAAPDAPAEYAAGAALSLREKEVLNLISQGLANKQIAARLKISTHTVKFHIGSILVKLGAASRAEAVTLGARRGELLL